ncbi:peptide chain release factor 1 [Sphaerochaeta pleomorpha str. Grapes]|uniref:Peptide chain release factor 1 n=1 Tax=Sphaerochaeta pleomorpha (strain ATCC BAA-1885 / DSM 22778 / Grapes) TaxID=158190 RepID=G8QVX5_SPHPG|nr:peptide chain release factor 1 [Sphaerochaeta pleomorpha]AEV30499.1 peptide chain release factor 1 [Sphaerochaeta pleomorpha str. Grapes]
MLEKLSEYIKQLENIDTTLSKPETMQDMKLFKNLNMERAHLAPIVDELKTMQSLKDQIADAEQLLHEETDAEMLEMTKEELSALKKAYTVSEQKTKVLLIPPDPMEGKNIIMEIRAGTGGDEAALFAADLFRMYSHFADTKGWKIEILSSNETGIGGYKELVFSVSGKDVYGSLRWESGVHRVQRVPETENGGRIHTSAVTVAVLPEAEETDIEIRQEDLRIDVMRAGGPGGQCVNTTDSAVRLTHLPTGLVVICQDEKSQIKNKAKAMRVLRSRLFDLEEDKKNKERAEARKSQVGSGDRSERIRTYNYPQNRLTDHRINLTLYKLELIMAGQMEEVVEGLKVAAGEAALKEA